MGEVVDKVSERWLSSIDKEEPEIVDDFLYKMKDAISSIHATEGYPKGKVLKPEEDWLTKIVKNNKKMQEMIPKYDKEDRKAVADSWDDPLIDSILLIASSNQVINAPIPSYQPRNPLTIRMLWTQADGKLR